ncbi:MAG: glycosyltransferase family 2 protein [Ktedonobacteraceae bacterium]
MFILYFMRWIVFVAEVVIACPVVYLCILSLSALIAVKRRSTKENSDKPARTNFAILIPAHNEEGILGTLLGSLSLLDYPKDLYTIYVIADNCTDTTATLAREVGGIRVYERFNTEKRGKGYALNWIWQKLTEDNLFHDAYIVLDADSVVISTFLQALDSELVQGAKAVQACNTVLNMTDSPSTVLRWIALTLINHVRPLGRNGIGASSTLTGNGMCLSQEIVKQNPWQAFGLAEDYQYYLTLVQQQGERVRYVPEAIVRSQMPITFDQMRTQDVRWEATGSQQSQWKIARNLLNTGIRLRSFVRIEAAIELLTPPLSFLVAACLLTLVASLFAWSLPDILVSLAILGGLVYYISTALFLLRPPYAVYKALLHAPEFMLWKLWVYFVLSRSKKYTNEWVRTSRIS